MADSDVSLAGARKVADRLRRAVDAALAAGRKLTDGGRAIDDHQPHSERLAYLATETAAVEALIAYAGEASAEDPFAAESAAIFTAMVAARARAQLADHADLFGVAGSVLDETLGAPDVGAFVRAGLADARIEALGADVVRRRGTPDAWLASDVDRATREAVRAFAREEVAPIAQRIHLGDELVPETIIQKMAELGFFGLSVPEEYGGQGMGNVAMILTTEELSAASLAAAGSLITRPEILTKALLAGGSEDQKRTWLPRIAAGEIMVAISVTEPDTGSDVASVKVRAERGEQGGASGWFISGAKAWCTFAGRANAIAMLTRTDPDPARGARGLSLFIVPKDSFPGHEFTMRQPGGGTIEGKADRTPGYRGMHSYTMQIDRYFVPAENLVGKEGQGFYLQMSGFAAGRLQTGGRATGVAQAAIEAAAAYASERSQFGQPIGTYPLTRYKLGRMAVEIAAARQLTYHAARLFDEDEKRALEPAMAKLFACDVAVRTTQEAQLLHGGWGFAEEFPVCRYVLDALVLPIFEGVKPILELKVIARNLLQ
ncbi:MAG TPA: acyl-CoA dehydrogenase family protein [Candidatus Binatia bacterium]|nr:acyl-CoA dehydrogenase family protein [Candidatus Binatia bacterium]